MLECVSTGEPDRRLRSNISSQENKQHREASLLSILPLFSTFSFPLCYRYISPPLWSLSLPTSPSPFALLFSLQPSSEQTLMKHQRARPQLSSYKTSEPPGSLKLQNLRSTVKGGFVSQRGPDLTAPLYHTESSSSLLTRLVVQCPAAKDRHCFLFYLTLDPAVRDDFWCFRKSWTALNIGSRGFPLSLWGGSTPFGIFLYDRIE